MSRCWRQGGRVVKFGSVVGRVWNVGGRGIYCGSRCFGTDTIDTSPGTVTAGARFMRVARMADTGGEVFMARRGSSLRWAFAHHTVPDVARSLVASGFFMRGAVAARITVLDSRPPRFGHGRGGHFCNTAVARSPTRAAAAFVGL